MLTETHFDVPSLYYAGVGLCLHKPKLGHGGEKVAMT